MRGRWRLLSAAGAVLLLVLGSTTYAVATQRELTSTKALVTSAQDDLRSLRTELDGLTSSLTGANRDLQASRDLLRQEQAARSLALAQVSELQKQVAQQTGCVQALKGNVTELRTIADLTTTNYNRITIGSSWATARAARETALLNTIDDFYQAFSNAYDGFKSIANSWIALGNTQSTVASQQLATMNAEIAKMNSTNSQLDAAFAAFAQHLSDTNATCGF